MRRQLAAVAALILAGGVADAQPPKLFEAPPPKLMVESAGGLIRRLQDEVELLEAHFETKRAYTRAAAVGVEGAKLKFKNVSRLAGEKVVSSDELDMARVDLDAAKAQLEVRMAEQREVEVRLMHAKRRLDEAKGPPPTPVPPKPAK
jgi:multidrug resistance efflux pump